MAESAGDCKVISFNAVRFDLDCVVTRTAALHAAAWNELFDAFLRVRVA